LQGFDLTLFDIPPQGCPVPHFGKDGSRTCLICIVATMAQQSKLSNSGSHLASKMRDEKPLFLLTNKNATRKV
jgi:hypothetical protein